MAGTEDGDLRTAELASMIREVRERVLAGYPPGGAGESRVPLSDLLPLVHARDAAEAKVAAIGGVNPRPAGPINALVQVLKRWVSRALDWHIREQVEYNRAVVECVNTTIEALNETNRAIVRLSQTQAELRTAIAETNRELLRKFEGPVMEELRQQKDIRRHWDEWRRGWEEKLSRNEIQFLRGLSDLRAAYDHRVSQIEANFRDQVRGQHERFTGALERSTVEIQKRLWEDLGRVRSEYEKVIHHELRTIRQRAASQRVVGSPAPSAPVTRETAPELDYLRFAECFRGAEEYVKRNQEIYVDHFRGCRQVLDLGCGRGEFLEVMRAAGIPARGIDLGSEFVAICREKGLEAAEADLFAYLEDQAPAAVDGIFCAQVIEHLPPARLPEFVRLASESLPPGGVIAIETPNPECLAIFATHFYLDPTHHHPVPSSLLSFYLEEAGFGRIEVRQLSPAVASYPALADLPETFRKAFFGGLDYGVLARKL